MFYYFKVKHCVVCRCCNDTVKLVCAGQDMHSIFTIIIAQTSNGCKITSAVGYAKEHNYTVTQDQSIIMHNNIVFIVQTECL